MRLSDLLEKPVYDEAGHSLGEVHDVKLVRDGPPSSMGDSQFRLHGLVAGRGTFGTRLGFGRGKVRGPLLIKVLFDWMQRRAFYVPWQAVRVVETERIVVRMPPNDFERLK